MNCSIVLQPKQVELLKGLEAIGPDVPTRWGYGGARGGGKSGALRRIAMILAGQTPEIAIAIVRKHYGDLVENHVEKLRLEYPDFHAKYYRQGDGEWRLDNGSRIVLAYGDTAKDIQEFSRGPEFAYIFVDQAEQANEQELTWLTIPNRWPGVRQRFAKSAFFFNPGGPGTEFLRRVFFKREFHKNENPADWAFIQAYGWDNYEWFRGEVAIDQKTFYSLPNDQRFEMFINQTSEGRKMNALPPAMRVGELLGSFEHFAGQYYAGVWDENTCVLGVSEAERLIQPWWKRWISEDWGFSHNNANHWAAAGKLSPAVAATLGVVTDWPIDVVIVYREFVTSGMGEEDLAREVVRLTPVEERRQIAAYWLGPDAFAKKGSANTVAEQIGRVLVANGMPQPEPADNARTSSGEDRVGGWRFLYSMFQRTAWRNGLEPVSREAAKSGYMLLISAACPELISAIPLAIRDDDSLEDVLKTNTIGDDCLDNLRYLCKSQLDAKSRAPRAVRAQEVYNSVDSPTAKHLAMLRFNEREKARGLAVRGPRWR